MNKVQLIGRLVKDPELRYTNTSNVPVCGFTLAVNKRSKNNQQEADFIQCQAWQKTAEVISNHCIKGQQIAVAGRINTRSWDNESGQRQYVTEVVVEEMHFIGKKQENRGDAHEEPTTLGADNSTTNQSGFFPLGETGEDELPF